MLLLSCMPRYDVMTVEEVARVKPAKMPTAAAVASYQEQISRLVLLTLDDVDSFLFLGLYYFSEDVQRYIKAIRQIRKRLSATSLTNTSKRYNRDDDTRHFIIMGKITHLKSKNKVKNTTAPTGYVRNQVYRRRKHDAKGAQEIRQGYGGQSQGEE